MIVKTFKPKNPVLANLIDCIYLLSRTENEPNVTYLTFPSHFSIQSIAKYTQIKLVGTKYLIQPNQKNEIQSSLVCRFKLPFCFEYQGKTEEVTIYYKPLGINAFLDRPLNDYSEGVLNSFEPYSDLEDKFREIFNNSDEDKIRLVEDYLLSKFKGFQHPFLTQFVADLMNDDFQNISIAELAKKYHVTPKTVIRNFELHLCKTPSEFRKIIRFRKALEKFNEQKELLSLTELSYILKYFDQSHQIRDFKSLTGFTPKQFFKKLSPSEDGKINWIFLS